MDLTNPDTTITAADLESLALQHLTELPVPGVEGRALDPEKAWAAVLSAAVEQTSIHDICAQTINTPCSDRVLEWLATVDHLQFENAVNDILARQAQQMLLKATPRSICLDFVDIHYHGRHHLSPTELCRTTPRDGTTNCHRYCAGFVISRNKPLILAFTWMHGDETKADAAERVLGRVGDLGLTIRCLVADRGFASAAGIDHMQSLAPVITPLIRRGKKLMKLLDTKVSYWTEYAMYEGTPREVRFPVAICVSYRKGKRGKTGLLIHAYAACEQDARTPKQVEYAYKQRSAIETSFRTFREALATTSTRDPGIRLVHVGVAFVLRNLWVLVGWAVLAQPRCGGRARPAWFPFKRFRKWIEHALDERLARIWEVPTNGVGIPVANRSAVAG
ncbi:ISH3 family transposase [Saliphagus sp. LR7]|uniref:ISH3 family transposase n=1 Tax=Saliphagus sp. LR7 TaxID=2282654 RepID=UPI000DF8127C|nr:ISH3 family transposase [Saliphagus sp. LR7]